VGIFLIEVKKSQAMKLLSLLILITLFFSENSFSKEIEFASYKNLKTYKNFHDWNLYKESRKGEDHCYLVSTPIETNSELNLKKKGESYFIITAIKNDVAEVSISSGISFYKNNDVELSFKNAKFYLFTQQYLAWAKDKNDDIEILKAMQKENEFIAKSISKNSKIIYDRYSLIGFVEAFKNMKELCKNNE
jgi:hypothetical protein